MSGASRFSPRGTIASAGTSRDVPSAADSRRAVVDDRPRAGHVVDPRERCANFGDIPARDARRSSRRALAREFTVVASPSFDLSTCNASRGASWSRRFVVADAQRPARIVCGHAGLNARTALDETLRARVRATVIDFFRAAFDRGCVDRKHEGSFTAAIDRANFVLAATTSPGGIKAGTVRSNTIPRGRSAGTFPSRARQVVRHSRESDPGGAGISAAPSRSGFPREGRRSSEDPGSMDQGGPK